MTDHNETNETNETTQAADLSRTETKAGFVALIGAPNAGKSTLMNAMVGHKVSIVTPKVQTTRSRIRGIGMHQNVQMIFVDTPGIFTPKRRLDRAMVQAAWQGAEDGDVLLLLHDCARRLIDEDTSNILTKLAASGRRASLVLNKIDLVDEKFLEDLKTKIKSNVIEVSANSDINIEILKEKIYEKLKFIRIYMKPKGEEADFKEPFIAREGDTVEDVCNKMHRRLKRQFRYGLVWGKSVKFGGQRVGLTHVMQDEDVITIIKRPGP